METPTVLKAAIFLWKRGDPIPLDMEAELLWLGFDVSALERRYRA